MSRWARISRIACAALLLGSAPAGADDVALLLRSGEYENAEQVARAMTGEPGAANDAAFLALGHALAAQGRIQAAIEAYTQARRDGQQRLDARLASARLQRLYGEDATGRFELGQVLARYRDDPRSMSATELVAAGHAARDLALRDPSLYRTALAAYEAAIQKAPSMPEAHVAMGELLLDRFNNTEALEAFVAALQADPEHPPALLGLARSQHFDHASTTRASVRQALELNPRYVEALCLQATLQIEQEEYEQAGATLHRALAVNPRSPQALTLRAGLSFLQSDEAGFQEQVAETRRTVPGYDAVYETLAVLAAQNRRYERAAQFALLSVTLNRESWRGHALLGTNRLRLGDMTSGRRSLEVAFEGDPFDPFTKNSLDLLDRLEDYPRIRSARFELVAASREARILVPLVLPIAEQAYDVFANAYGYQPATPIRIEIYPRHEDFSVRTVGLTGVDIVGVSFGPVVAMDSPSAGVFGPLNLGSVIWHEIAHSFHLGMTEAKVPRWFSEGLAVFEERRGRPGWGADVSPEFLASWKAGKLPRPSRLNEVFLRPSAPEVLMHGYYQASLLMELIEAQHGFDAIVAMLRAYGDGKSTGEAIRQALGQEPEALDAAFDAFMSARFDAAARALAPTDGASTASAAYPALLESAGQAMKADDLDKALQDLREAQRLLPELAGGRGSYRLLARVHEKRGELPEAIAQLYRSLAIDADDLEAHQELARLHEAAGEPLAAADALADSLLIQPFDATVHRKMAELYEVREEWFRAVPARAAVVDLDDTDPARARYLLARAHHRAGDPDAARARVIEALELAPMYDEALELLLRIREGGVALSDTRGDRP